MPSDFLNLSEEYLEQQSLETAYTIPSEWYTDPEFHTIDLAHVFSTTWQYVGAASRIASAGDYLVATVGKTPVLAVRQKSGEIAAFYNVCKHRGGPLAMDECGSSTMLQCKYHGWTYQLDGSLRGVPRFNRTELFDKKDFGLTRLEVAQWQGLVFIRASAGGPSIDNCFEGIAERIAPADLGAMKFHGRVSYDLACNWKVYVDNYLEGYHVPLVHPELCDAIDYSEYVTEVHTYHSLQCSPMLAAGDYGNAETVGGEALYYFVYPNFMLNILPGRLQTNVVVPLAPDRCRVLFNYYYPQQEFETDLGGLNKRAQTDYEFSDRVQQEDIEICEHVQLGLESPAYDRGRFSAETEAGVHHFQSLLKESYRNGRR